MPTPTQPSLDQLNTWLTEARASYHQLQTGGAVTVFVDQNGERVQYTVGNRDDLRAYIMTLESQIRCYGVPSLAAFRPLGFYF